MSCRKCVTVCVLLCPTRIRTYSPAAVAFRQFCRAFRLSRLKWKSRRTCTKVTTATSQEPVRNQLAATPFDDSEQLRPSFRMQLPENLRQITPESASRQRACRSSTCVEIILSGKLHVGESRAFFLRKHRYSAFQTAKLSLCRRFCSPF